MDYLKIPEVARRLDVSEPTVRRMVKSGKLPSVFIGGAYRVSEEDLEKYLEAAKVEPGDGSPKVAPPPSPVAPNEEERRLLRAWRAFVYKLVHRWEASPPTSRQEVAVVLEAMQALIAEGAFERPPAEISTGSWDAAGEWMEKTFLFRGIEKLNRIADDIEAGEEAERRRAAFREIKDRMAETA